VTKSDLTNVAASVRTRLLNRSHESGEDFQFLLQRYAAERFLYRLGESAHRNNYVLKGAMLFALWGGSAYRPTRDLDFTGYGSNGADEVVKIFKEICAVAVPDDGLSFDTKTVKAEPIRDEAEYHGLRVTVQAMLGVSRILDANRSITRPYFDIGKRVRMYSRALSGGSLTVPGPLRTKKSPSGVASTPFHLRNTGSGLR